MRKPVLLLIIAVATLFGSADALAHSELRAASPGPGETVGVFSSVQLEFFTPIEPEPLNVELADPDGRPVALDAPELLEERFVVARISDPERTWIPGEYRITHRTLAADGDTTPGAFLFSFDEAAESPAGLIRIETEDGGWTLSRVLVSVVLPLALLGLGLLVITRRAARA